MANPHSCSTGQTSSAATRRRVSVWWMVGSAVNMPSWCAPGGMCRVRDLHSTNGTFVNGLRVDDRVLVDRDVVDFGGVKLRFRV